MATRPRDDETCEEPVSYGSYLPDERRKIARTVVQMDSVKELKSMIGQLQEKISELTGKKDQDPPKKARGIRKNSKRFMEFKYRATTCRYVFEDRKTCAFETCPHAHTVDELRICPFGTLCNSPYCNFLLHSEADRIKFVESISSKFQF